MIVSTVAVRHVAQVQQKVKQRFDVLDEGWHAGLDGIIARLVAQALELSQVEAGFQAKRKAELTRRTDSNS